MTKSNPVRLTLSTIARVRGAVPVKSGVRAGDASSDAIRRVKFDSVGGP